MDRVRRLEGTIVAVVEQELENLCAAIDNAAGSGDAETELRLVRAQASEVTGSASLSLSSAITHAGGAVELKCTEEEADIDVLNATLTAIEVGSLG